VLTHDFYKKKIRPLLTEKQEVFTGRTFTVIIGGVTILLAILFNALRELNLMDIMFRVFSAFGPAVMIPLIFGLLFKKFNARGILSGVIAGSATGVALVVTNFFLIQIYAEEMTANSTLDFWLRSGWNSAATLASVAATIIGMWLGTSAKPTPQEEKERVNDFFKDLQQPFLFEEKEKKPLSPFKIIGFMLIAFGLLMAAISVFILLHDRNTHAFKVDVIVALVLAFIGALMQAGKRRKPA
jgi:Na+(H+)/acetate symporter ActP